MRKVFVGCFVMGLLMLAALPAFAQDATPTLVPTPETYQPVLGQPLNILEASLQNNICPEVLIGANRSLIGSDLLAALDTQPIGNLLWEILPVNITIPPHQPCYDIVETHWADLAQVEKDHNVCIEEFYNFIQGSDGRGNMQMYLRKDALPCVNEAGQRLQYFDQEGQRLKTPIYSDVLFVNGPDDLMQQDICTGDLVRANPAIYFGTTSGYGSIGYITGMRLFVPQDSRHCDVFATLGKSLYQMSRDKNVCMETILEASGFSLFSIQLADGISFSIPTDAPGCYDASGQRIGHKDREVYVPHEGDSMLDIAQSHNVCLNDLWDANPVMNAWNGWTYVIPDIVFIPDTPACAEQRYTTRPKQTLHALSLLTNVCINRLIEANPSVAASWLSTLPVGETLTIPHRPHCYNLSDTTHGLTMQPHICYSEPVTADSDFTGHVPPISVSDDTDLPYCQERVNGMTVFYENAPYLLYKTRSLDNVITMGQCFGIDPDILLRVNASIPKSVSLDNWDADNKWVLIPQPSNSDCWMLHTDDEHYRQRYQEETYKAGYLIDGVYTVNYGDTLSSIGRQYGYPYQWIADANNISDSYTIYFLQELQMPRMPSLYDIGKGMLYVGGVSVGMIGFGLYRMRRRGRGKGKKKNIAA